MTDAEDAGRLRRDRREAAPPDTGFVIPHAPAIPDAAAPMWPAPPPPPTKRPGRFAPWALVVAIIALVSSFFFGWGIPLAVLAVVLSIVALRRRWESRVVTGWALVLGILATVYSAGWLLWTAWSLGLWG